MGKHKTRFYKFNSRIKNNPILAVLIIVGTIIIALSTFTNATKNLLSLKHTLSRADINGNWMAEIPYSRNNKTFNELFTFKGEDDELSGTATQYRRGKRILEGTIKKDKIEFLITIQEILDGEDNPKEAVYHYEGTIVDEQITFVLQKEGGHTIHNPIEFTAHRVLSRSFDSDD